MYFYHSVPLTWLWHQSSFILHSYSPSWRLQSFRQTCQLGFSIWTFPIYFHVWAKVAENRHSRILNFRFLTKTFRNNICMFDVHSSSYNIDNDDNSNYDNIDDNNSNKEEKSVGISNNFCSGEKNSFFEKRIRKKRKEIFFSETQLVEFMTGRLLRMV